MVKKSTSRRKAPSTARKAPARARTGRVTRALRALEAEVLGTPADGPLDPQGRLRLRVAADLAARRSALALLGRAAGATLHDLAPDATVLLAERDLRPIGTATVLLDGPLGLPLDALLPESAAGLRRPGRRLAEVRGLAIVPELGPDAQTVLFGLLRAACLAARQVGQAADLATIAPESHAELYRRLGAEPVGRCGANALFRVELDRLDDGLFRRYAGPPGMDAEELAGWLAHNRQPLSEPDLLALLAERRAAFAALPPDQRHAFEDMYLAYDLQKVLQGGGAGKA